MALKDFVATDRDRLNAANDYIAQLRTLLRDIYDLQKDGKLLTPSIEARIRRHMSSGR